MAPGTKFDYRNDGVVVDRDEASNLDVALKRPLQVCRYMVDCMVSVHTDPSHARQLADTLIAGDYRGHYSHGLNRFGNCYGREIIHP
jgi:hypothetical protein